MVSVCLLNRMEVEVVEVAVNSRRCPRWQVVSPQRGRYLPCVDCWSCHCDEEDILIIKKNIKEIQGPIKK